MAGKSRHSRRYDGIWFLKMLRTRARLAPALVLALFLLFNSAAFAYAELHADHHCDPASHSSLFTLSDNHDLTSEPAENREVRSGREVFHAFWLTKLDAKLPRIQIWLVSRSTQHIRFAVFILPSLLSAFACEAPFSPRPPPATSFQV